MSAERYTPERLMAWADKATQFSERDVMRRLAEAWEREIERLRAERDTLQQNWQRCVDHAARVEEENGRLREALRPLAELDFSAWSEAHEDDDAVLLLALEVGVGTGGTACITIGDVRRAREALAATDLRGIPDE